MNLRFLFSILSVVTLNIVFAFSKSEDTVANYSLISSIVITPNTLLQNEINIESYQKQVSNYLQLNKTDAAIQYSIRILKKRKC